MQTIKTTVHSFLFILFIGLVTGSHLSAQTEAPTTPAANEESKKKAENSQASENSEATSEQLEVLFHATSSEVLEEGRVRLVYNFESKDGSLLQDWSPDIESTKRRIRWSQGMEGTFDTVEDGLVIADRGVFLHKGTWSPDVKVQVDYLSMANGAEKDLLATIYSYDRNKRIVGSQIGVQCVRLSKQLKRKGKAIPRRLTDLLPSSQKINFGMELKDEVFSSLRSGSKRADTAGEKKFLQKLQSGKVGLAWRGNVNGFIFKITIEGKLDHDWLSGESKK